MDKIKAMQTVVSISDNGSLTAAAVALDSSVPSVVRTLATLEAQLGVRLFNRTTRNISLTEAGRQYIESCRQLLASLEEMEASIVNDALEPSGLLTLTAPIQLGQMYVAPAITRFLRQYPKVRIKLILLDRVVNLVEENIDVGIRIGTLEDSSLVAHSVGEINRVVVASPEYIQQQGEPQHPKQLLAANCIRFTGSSAFAWNFLENNKEFQVPVSGNYELNQIAPTIDACVAGLGFSMLMSYQVQQQIRQQRLQVVLKSFQLPPRPINIVYPSRHQLPARTKVFVEWIKTELKTALMDIDGRPAHL